MTSYIVAAQHSEHLAAAVELHEEALLEVLPKALAKACPRTNRSMPGLKDGALTSDSSTHFLELRLRGRHFERSMGVDDVAEVAMRALG